MIYDDYGQILEARIGLKDANTWHQPISQNSSSHQHMGFSNTKSDREILNYLEGSISHEYLMLGFKSHLGHRIKRTSYTNMWDKHRPSWSSSGILSSPDRLEILIRCNQSEQFLTSCCLGGGWRWKLFLDVGNGNDKPSDPPILWDHHFMIKSYFNLKLCILCKIYLDMSTENSGKRTLKMLSTFNWMKKFLFCRFLQLILIGESRFSCNFFQRRFRITWQLTGAKTCCKHL